MTCPAGSSEFTSPPTHVWVYGGDHSPWVQSVLLGLHEKKIDHTNVTVPPLRLFLNSGVVMPAAKLDDGPWLLDSECILACLGFSSVVDKDRRALRSNFAGALERTDRAWEFWRRWSYLRDGHPSLPRRLWNHFWRTFSVFYFFVLITIARYRLMPRTTAQVRQGFQYFEEKLESSGPFLGGGTPDTVDLQLFGHVQMFGSIPGRSLAVLRQDPNLPRLRAWIERMQDRFEEYAHLYTGSCFEPPLPAIERSPFYERFFYWLGCGAMWLAFPISFAATLYLVRRVRAKGLVRN